MALQKTITLGNGLVAPDAYIRVDSIMGCKTTLSFSVNSYLSADAFAGTGPYMAPNPAYDPETPEAEPELLPVPQGYLEQELVEFAPDLEAADNFIAQAYAHLKTLPKYAGAADV